MDFGDAMRIFLLLMILLPANVWAYANFIGHGYQSCMNCHFQPLGGGQLNDYGRAVSATLISSRALYPKTWSEEKIADTSGFLFRKPKQNWLRLQANYRGFSLVQNPGSSKNSQKRWIPMQMDFRAAVKFGENDKFIAVADIGKDPKTAQEIPGMGRDRYRSRNHYLGYRLNKKFGLYAGLMDKAYGLRIIEHIAFSRTVPQVDQDDQTHGVMAHYLDESWEGAIHGFVGNLTTASDLRAKGASAFFEKTVAGAHRIGGSFLTQKNNYMSLMSYAVHGRFNIKEGSAVLAEIGQTKKNTDNNLDEATSRYGLLQTSVRPIRGVYFLTNIDYLKADIRQSDYTVRWGPALQYFPVQRIELRADIYDTRNFSSSASKDSWMYLLQTHIWL
jgi:hypothetical protein